MKLISLFLSLILTTLSLLLPTSSPAQISGGTLSGVSIGDYLSLYQGYRRGLVALFKFYGNAVEPWNNSYIDTYFFGQIGSGGIGGFFKETSYSYFTLHGDVTAWYQLPEGVTENDSWVTIKAASDALLGEVSSDYKYVFYVYNTTAHNLFSFLGSTTRIWLMMDNLGGTGALGVQLHELIHCFGLTHSAGLRYSTKYLNSPTNTQTGPGVPGTQSPLNIDYGDMYDVMGANVAGPYGPNVVRKDTHLSWIGSSMGVVDSSGEYVLKPLESQSGGVKALKILRQNDVVNNFQQYYYVEYRRATGVDAGITNGDNSLLIHFASSMTGYPLNSYLLDMTPESNTGGGYTDLGDIPALRVGYTYYDEERLITITNTAADANEATVTITIGSPAGVYRVNPVVVMGEKVTGPPITYSISVTNNDASYFGSSVFSLTATNNIYNEPALPLGWTAVFDNPTLTIAPGGTGTATLTVTPNANPPVDNYMWVTVTNKSNPLFWTQAGQEY